VTSRNVADVLPTWELARDLGAGFDLWPVNHRPDLAVRDPEDVRALGAAYDRLAAQDPRIAERRAYLEGGIRYHGGRTGRVRCLGLVAQYGVTWEGVLLPCCVWSAPALRVGNVFETPLRTLWNGPAATAMRDRIRRQGCTAGCWNHGLHDFERATGLPALLEGTCPG
jgi:MoaA/NifB/PqqE/SkfB family radical SAM enzyme